MCLIETSIHTCGHASSPIHEFCPRNPCGLLPNEHGACQKGYERNVPLLSSICCRCVELLDRQQNPTQHAKRVVKGLGHIRQAKRSGSKSCEVESKSGDDGSEEEEEDEAGRRGMVDGQVKGGRVGAVALPVVVKGLKIARQQ
jgi:hypothetical protein